MVSTAYSQIARALPVEELVSLLRSQPDVAQAVLDRRGAAYGISQMSVALKENAPEDGPSIRIAYKSTSPSSGRGTTVEAELFLHKPELSWLRLSGLIYKGVEAVDSATAAVTMTDPTREQ